MNKKIVGMMLACLIVCTMLLVPQADAQKTVTITDSSGNRVKIPYPVERIAVLTPTASEIIVALGAENRVVGIDQYTKWNDEFKRFNASIRYHWWTYGTQNYRLHQQTRHKADGRRSGMDWNIRGCMSIHEHT